MSTTALTRPLVTSLVEDAVTAPSIRTGADTIELHGAPSREMPREDPDHRALHIG
ncbi:hypothetical protein [Streptomyces sp. NPDC004788]